MSTSSAMSRPPASDFGVSSQTTPFTTGRFELEQHELQLLVKAVRTTDLLTQLEDAVRRDGALITTLQGLRAHPGAVEARQQRLVLARLLAALHLPADEDEAEQRAGRGGPRGPYTLRPGPRAVS